MMFHTAISLIVFAFQILISGTVHDARNGEPVTGAIAVYKNSEGKVLKYTTSDKNGKYDFSVATISDGDSIHFSMMGYKPVSIAAKEGKGGDVPMISDAINIKEVVIRAPKIEQKGDTIRYSISSFAEAQDKNIGDVLRKLPGIDVEKSGQIKYNGEPINKLYIEGIDMLEGKYGLATNNIPPKDVKSVEILENHQPKKVLKDIEYSEQAALNIKLQEGAKARWIATMELRGGLSSAPSPLWEGKLFGMRIGKNNQSINTVKSNNIGKDIRKELNTFGNFYFSGEKYTLNDYLSVGVANAPLEEERVRFNRSHLFSTTNSWKLSPEYQLKAQVSYLNERLTSHNSAQTNYFLNDSTITIREGNNGKSLLHSASGSLQITSNADNFYLDNKISASGEWKTFDVSTLGSSPVFQSAMSKSFEAEDKFYLTRRAGKRFFSISSDNQYYQRPQLLDVTIEGREPLKQEIFQRAFHSNSTASFGLKFSRAWMLNLGVGFEALVRSMNSSLTDIDDNDLSMHFCNTYFKPSLEYNGRKLKISLNAPLNYYYYRYRDFVSDLHTRTNDFLLNPKLKITCSLSSTLLLSISGSISKSPVNEKNFHSGLILSNYRTLNRGYNSFENALSKTVSSNLEYRNPINSLFFRGYVSRSWEKYPNISSRSFIENFIVGSFLPITNDAKTWSALLSGSKGLFSINGVVGIEGIFTSTNAVMEQNTGNVSTLTPYCSTNIVITPRINGRLSSWSMFEYKLSYTHSILEMTDNAAISRRNFFNHTLALTLTPVKSLDIKVVAEHYFTELSDTQNKNTVLADIFVTYCVNDKIEISLSTTNILNQATYSYTSFNGPSSLSAEYGIRPLNILLGAYIKF